MAIVTFSEMDGYPLEVRDLYGLKATRKLRCAWEDRYTLRGLLLAHPPALYPYNPDFVCRAVNCGIEPFGGSNQSVADASMTTYPEAILTVNYETPKTADPQPYPKEDSVVKHEDPTMVFSESFDPYVEARRLDYTKFRWSSGEPLTADESPIIPLSRAHYSVTRYNQPAAPSDILDYVGKINSATVTPVILGSFTFPIHTLLFEPPTINLTADDQGGRTFEISYKFWYKEEGWRKFWRAQTEQYESIINIDTEAAYESPEEIDFNGLLPQGT
jgi:hypothetical protein